MRHLPYQNRLNGLYGLLIKGCVTYVKTAPAWFWGGVIKKQCSVNFVDTISNCWIYTMFLFLNWLATFLPRLRLWSNIHVVGLISAEGDFFFRIWLFCRVLICIAKRRVAAFIHATLIYLIMLPWGRVRYFVLSFVVWIIYFSYVLYVLYVSINAMMSVSRG